MMREKLKELLSNLNWWQKILFILALAVIVYFSNACAFKSFYTADNVTHSFDFSVQE